MQQSSVKLEAHTDLTVQCG